MANTFSIKVALKLLTDNFTQGVNKATTTTKSFAKGVSGATKTITDSFGVLASNITGSLGSISPIAGTGLSAMRGLVGGINSVKTALLASGIGIAVVAIGAAFGALNSYMTGTLEGSQKTREAFSVVKGAATETMNRVRELGKGLFSLFSGDFAAFGESLKNIFDGNFTQSVVAGAAVAKALAKEQNDLQREKIALDNEEIDVLNQQAILITKSKDVTKESNYTAAQRLDFIKQEVAIGDAFDEKKVAHLKKEWEWVTKVNKQKKLTSVDDINAELAAKKAYYEYLNADRKDAMSENKIIAKTEKEIDSDAATAAKDRIDSEKQYRVERQQTIQLEGKYKAKGRADFLPVNAVGDRGVNTKDFEVKKLEKYSEAVTALGTSQQMLFNSSLSGWENIKGGITNTQFLAEQTSTAVSGLTEAFSGLFEGTEGGFKNMVTSMLGGIQQIINALLAQAVAAMIAGEAHKGIVGLATGAIGVAVLTGLWKSKIPAFENGGIVGGSSFTGDRVPVLTNSREMILNQSQQANLFNMANTGSGSAGGGTVDFRIEGNALVGVLNNHNKRMNNFK